MQHHKVQQEFIQLRRGRRHMPVMGQKLQDSRVVFMLSHHYDYMGAFV